MFKRTAVALSLLVLSSLAAAQQPAAWPWQPVQVWAVPVNGQAIPFPTPFWLWVIPPAVEPASAPVVRSEPAPTSPAAVVPPGAKSQPVEVVPAPAQTAAMPATAPTPVAVPAATVAKPVAPVEQPAVVATPLQPAAPVSTIVTPAITPAAAVVNPVAPVEIPTVPAGVEESPAPVKRAPVAKKTRKPVAGTPARQLRKLCFKGGKLDVCP
ncbi:MAG: hypothetical protein Q8O33_18905 [Pseudomonadota bacterium]|nr:hypothetical protein [Pseudomonadota bacterium]